MEVRKMREENACCEVDETEKERWCGQFVRQETPSLLGLAPRPVHQASLKCDSGSSTVATHDTRSLIDQQQHHTDCHVPASTSRALHPWLGLDSRWRTSRSLRATNLLDGAVTSLKSAKTWNTSEHSC